MLEDFFREHPNIALAFSGGTDSAYLLYEAMRAGARCTAYYVRSEFQPAFELKDAERLAAELHAKLTVLPLSVLSFEEVASNPADRCYACKRQIFRTVLAAAAADGCTEIMDGTNASDIADDRPGMRVLTEMKILSPLRMAGLTKERIRELSREAGLFTWNKPAYACLATRIPTGLPITAAALARTEQAEEALKALGYTDFRVRQTEAGEALVQLRREERSRAAAHWHEIEERLERLYPGVILDTRVR